MAQADFNFLTNTTGYTAPNGGSDGTTILHSSLANPLTGYGTYGRQYTYGGNPASTIVGAIAASVDGGVWVGTPNTHALSLRLSVRLDGTDLPTGSGEGRCVGVAAKTGRMGTGSVPRTPSGYYLIHGRMYHGFAEQSNLDSLTLIMIDENCNFSGKKEVRIIDNMGANLWHRIRLDVIPVGSSQDIVKCYTGTGAIGSEVWTLQYEETIVNSAAWYCNWSDPTSNRVGFLSHCSGSTQANDQAYIDGFVAMREAV